LGMRCPIGIDSNVAHYEQYSYQVCLAAVVETSVVAIPGKPHAIAPDGADLRACG